MIESRSSLYHRHRFPAEIIAEAVWLYYRFPLSFRMVEDMLAYRGIIRFDCYLLKTTEFKEGSLKITSLCS